MKPHVLCHMAISIDGRTLLPRWRPQANVTSEVFEKTHADLDGDAWLIGRVTGQEYAKRESYPASAATLPREPWFARERVETPGIVLDPYGKIAWGRSDIGGDPIVVVLTESVPDAHLAGLRADGVSYLFAGKREIDLRTMLRILREELGIERLLLEGGGGVNGAFLQAGLIDEISVLVFPVVDGAEGAPSLFQSPAERAGHAPVTDMTLTESETLPGGILRLRYRLHSAADEAQ